MHPDTERRAKLAVAVVLIAAAIVAIEQPWEAGSTVPDPPEDIPESALENPGAPDFAGATDWINSEPIDLVDQRGKVVLVDFWTYSCINCINTFPYLNAWYDTYEDDGLVMVGVHTPEFRFERDLSNIRDATDRYGLDHPVAVDNDYAIWDAYDNRYWPSKYLIDRWGRIRFAYAGEGGYNTTETKIRELLREAGRDPGPWSGATAKGGGYEPGQTGELFASDLHGHKDPDIGNPEGYQPGQNVTYAEPDEIKPDRIYLVGTWHNGRERSVARTNGSVIVRFTAGGANFVAGQMNGTCVPVLLDGRPIPDRLSAADVDLSKDPPCVHLDADRAFDLYSGPFEDHRVRLEVPPGFALYTFAFSEEGRGR